MGWLEFVAALVLGAVMWALLADPTNRIHDKANATTTTTAGQTGVDWLGIWIDWLPLWILLLGVFGFIVTVVVRQERVFR